MMHPGTQMIQIIETKHWIKLEVKRMLLHVGAFQLDIDRLPLALFSSSYPATVYITKRVCYCSDAQWTLVDLGNLRIRCIRVISLSRVTLPTLLKRVVEFAFVGVVLLGILFRSGGQVIWSWDRYKLQQWSDGIR